MNTENEIYSLATCPGTKYSGDTITLRATPRDGIGPYYVAFKKDGIIIDPSRLGNQPNPITNATENLEITRTYTLDDADVSNALTGTIDFSVFIRGSCPTGGGLQFDGVNDYVDAGNGVSLQPINAITYEAWVKPASSILQRIMNSSFHALRLVGNIIGAWVYAGGDDIITYNTGGSIYNGNWHHLVFTWQQNGTKNIYYDGVNVASLAASNNTPIAGNQFNIGKSVGGAEYFNGTIDEVRIYNRALSPTEVLNNYNGYTSRNGLVLEHIYSLGNANDLSGYGNNGTPINGPVFIPNACMDTCTVAIGCIAPVCNFVVT